MQGRGDDDRLRSRGRDLEGGELPLVASEEVLRATRVICTVYISQDKQTVPTATATIFYVKEVCSKNGWPYH